MTAIASPPRLTPTDLLNLDDEIRFELVDGQLVERAMGALSTWIGTQVTWLLKNVVRQGALGWVFGGEASYQCYPWAPEQVRRPDASFIRRGRLTDEVLPAGHIRISPDLAVEVLSPNDNGNEIDTKVTEYLRAGVHLVWVVYPNTRSVVVFRPDGSARRVREEDLLTGEDIIPGFQCMVSELFPPTLASA